MKKKAYKSKISKKLQQELAAKYVTFKNMKPYPIGEALCFPDKKQYLWEDLWNLFETKSREKRLSNKKEYFIKQGMKLLKKAQQDKYYYEYKMLAGEIWELLS